MFGEDFIPRALIGGPIILFSLTVHEFFHAWSASKFGDNTAKNMGRLTLNPLAHLDLMGTLMMVMSGFRFGWAKPVPVNLFNLRNPRKANLWISAAGPLSNLAMAIIAGLLYRSIVTVDAGVPAIVPHFLSVAVSINVTLAFFNLIPLFPLDGSHVLKSLLPSELETKLNQFDRFAPILLIVLLVTGSLWIFLWPPVMLIIGMILGG